jgi:hypothetical protein
MNATSRATVALSVLLLLSPATGRAQVVRPANTGDPANLVAGVDSRWQVSIDNGVTWFAAFQVQNPPSPPWEPNSSTYSWISATPSGSGGGGNYLFRTFFDLTGEDVSSMSLTFQCVIDNERASNSGYYSLNGSAYGGTCGSGSTTGFRFADTQTLVGLNGGANELRFKVTGDSQTDGLLVGYMTLETSAVPEPSSVVLFATGLVAVLGGGFRRRRLGFLSRSDA